MRYLLLSISLLDACFALRFLVHLGGFLRHGKVGHLPEIAAGLLLVAMAASGAYVFWTGGDLQLGFAAAVGPWLLFVLVMFVALVTGRQQ